MGWEGGVYVPTYGEQIWQGAMGRRIPRLQRWRLRAASVGLGFY